MSVKKKHDGYFGRGIKQHTEIKLSLFHKTLKTSYGIASMISNNFKYVYLDLFAGDGTYSDGAIGSPLLALKEFSVPLRKKKPFQVYCAFCEKYGYNKLKKNLESFRVSPNVVYEVYQAWEDVYSRLETLKNSSEFGFIFADQFSTELDLNLFLNLVGHGKHEFLIFYSANTLLRHKGNNRDHAIAKVLGITPEEVRKVESSKFKDFILNTLRQKILNYRDFVSIAAFPVTVKEKLIWSDYFYLVLGTNDARIVDAFITEYGRLVEKYRPLYTKGLPPLFSPFKTFKEGILEIVRFLYSKGEPSFKWLYFSLTLEYLSWKQTTTYQMVVPTLKNIMRALYELEQERKIRINAPENMRYTRTSQHGVRGQLKHKLRYLKDFNLIRVYPV